MATLATSTPTRISASWLVAWIIVLLAPGTAEPRDGGPGELEEDPFAGVETLVVTASPTAALLERTTSVVAFDAEDLADEGITDIRDLSAYTPNLEIKTAFAASNATLFIRGVGLDDDNANAASSVAVYQDGIYMNSPAGQLFQLFDVDRLDVLRGPQGVLRNASAGAVRVHSRLPSYDFGATLSTTYGNYNAVVVEGSLNVPIVPDMLAWRGAFVFSQRDGILNNRCNERIAEALVPDQRPCTDAVGRSLSKNLNDRFNWAGRSLLKSDLELAGREVELVLNIHGGRNDSDSTQFQHRGWQGIGGSGGFLQPGRDQRGYQDTDGDPFAGDYDFEGDERLSLLGASVRLQSELGAGFSVDSITGYEWHDREVQENTDANPRTFLLSTFTDRAWQVSHETSIVWDWASESDVKLGGMYLRGELDSRNQSFQLVRPVRTFDQEFSQDTDAFGIYASSHVEANDVIGDAPDWVQSFFLDLEARFSWERKQFELESTLLQGSGGNPSIPLTKAEETFVGWSASAALSYRIREESELYLKYSRGWKPGGFNGGSVFTFEEIEPVGEETVDSFEIGMRSTWLDGVLMFNAAGFIYLYRDLQVFVLQEARGLLTPRLLNAEEADVMGVEIDFRAIPVEGLEIRFAGAWLDSEYVDFSTSFPRATNSRVPPFVENVDVNFSGNRLISSPEFSFTTSVEYAFDVGKLGVLTPRFSAAWKDNIFFGPNEGRGQTGFLPDGTLGEADYWLLNAQLRLEVADGNIEITGWVRNLLDEEYKVQSFDLTQSAGLSLDAYGEPRTYGLTFTASF